MNRIYCAIGKIVEVTQFIEVRLGDICEKSEIIKEFSKITLFSLKNLENCGICVLFFKFFNKFTIFV